MISMLLLMFAFVLLAIAGAWAPEPPWKSRLACYGLACWVLAVIIEGAKANKWF